VQGSESLKAVVLAGGLGTRLRPLTYSRPKPMLPLGPKPVLQYVIELLADSGFNEIVVTTNYLQDQIEGYFGDGSRFGVSLRFPREEKPLGTAGSVKNAQRYLDETFALIQGDNITDIKMANQLKYHKKKNATTTLSVLKVKEPWKYGVVMLNKDTKIVGFQEKPPRNEYRSDLINTGLYILEPDVLDVIPPNKPFDFARDVFPILLEQRRSLYAYRAKGFWTDIGSIEGFFEGSRWVLSKVTRNFSSGVDASRARVTGSVQIAGGTTLGKGVTIRGPAYIEDNCAVMENTVLKPGTILKRNVSIGENSRINSALVFESTKIRSNVTLNRCIIDQKCEIGSNSVIEDLAIIGAGCTIGEDAVIGREVKIDPGVIVEQGKTIRI
jgi:mannose-1-phosphate guanylyltransferase/phosphomannomutase